MGSVYDDIALWTSRVRAACAATLSALALTGIDFKSLATTLSGVGPFASVDMANVQVLTGKLLYWIVVPAVQLVSALLVADAWMYCLHRLGHTNKWIYSKSRESPAREFPAC